MTISCTLPEDIIGIPLYIPNQFGYFDVETGALPNGDAALAVRGDLSTSHKAFMIAPHLSPVDIFYTADAQPTGTGRTWAMSCWLKLANLGGSGSGDVMLGCTAEQSGSFYADTRNQTAPLLLGSAGTNGYQVFREPLNNIASPPQTMSNWFSGSWQGFQDYWFLFVINQLTSGGFAQVTALMDTYASADAGDTVAGGTSAALSFITNPRPYLHLGAYNNGGVGRAGLWRIGKWAFHDHALTQAERLAMWQAMYGAGPFVYADDFNRATLLTNWKAINGASVSPSFDILSNQARAVPSSFKAMAWVRDLGSPKHYAQVSVASHGSGGLVAPAVRTIPYQASFGGYWGGWQSGSWFINRNGTGSIATSAASSPTLPAVVRLEVETNGSGNVDLRLYSDGVLKLSFTDSSGSKILTGSNAALFMQGSGADALADNFECGTY